MFGVFVALMDCLLREYMDESLETTKDLKTELREIRHEISQRRQSSGDGAASKQSANEADNTNASDSESESSESGSSSNETSPEIARPRSIS